MLQKLFGHKKSEDGKKNKPNLCAFATYPCQVAKSTSSPPPLLVDASVITDEKSKNCQDVKNMPKTDSKEASDSTGNGSTVRSESSQLNSLKLKEIIDHSLKEAVQTIVKQCSMDGDKSGKNVDLPTVCYNKEIKSSEDRYSREKLVPCVTGEARRLSVESEVRQRRRLPSKVTKNIEVAKKCCRGRDREKEKREKILAEKILRKERNAKALTKKMDNRRMTGNVNIYICSEANENVQEKGKKKENEKVCSESNSGTTATVGSTITAGGSSSTSSKLLESMKKKREKARDRLSCLCEEDSQPSTVISASGSSDLKYKTSGRVIQECPSLLRDSSSRDTGNSFSTSSRDFADSSNSLQGRRSNFRFEQQPDFSRKEHEWLDESFHAKRQINRDKPTCNCSMKKDLDRIRQDTGKNNFRSVGVSQRENQSQQWSKCNCIAMEDESMTNLGKCNVCKPPGFKENFNVCGTTNSEEKFTVCRSGNSRENCKVRETTNFKEKFTVCRSGNLQEKVNVCEVANSEEKFTVCGSGNLRENFNVCETTNSEERFTVCGSGGSGEKITVCTNDEKLEKSGRLTGGLANDTNVEGEKENSHKMKLSVVNEERDSIKSIDESEKNSVVMEKLEKKKGFSPILKRAAIATIKNVKGIEKTKVSDVAEEINDETLKEENKESTNNVEEKKIENNNEEGKSGELEKKDEQVVPEKGSLVGQYIRKTLLAVKNLVFKEKEQKEESIIQNSNKPEEKKVVESLPKPILDIPIVRKPTVPSRKPAVMRVQGTNPPLLPNRKSSKSKLVTVLGNRKIEPLQSPEKLHPKPEDTNKRLDSINGNQNKDKKENVEIFNKQADINFPLSRNRRIKSDEVESKREMEKNEDLSVVKKHCNRCNLPEFECCCSRKLENCARNSIEKPLRLEQEFCCNCNNEKIRCTCESINRRSCKSPETHDCFKVKEDERPRTLEICMECLETRNNCRCKKIEICVDCSNVKEVCKCKVKFCGSCGFSLEECKCRKYCATCLNFKDQCKCTRSAFRQPFRENGTREDSPKCNCNKIDICDNPQKCSCRKSCICENQQEYNYRKICICENPQKCSCRKNCNSENPPDCSCRKNCICENPQKCSCRKNCNSENPPDCSCRKNCICENVQNCSCNATRKSYYLTKIYQCKCPETEGCNCRCSIEREKAGPTIPHSWKLKKQNDQCCCDITKPCGSDKLPYQRLSAFSHVMNELQQKISESVCCSRCRRIPCCCRANDRQKFCVSCMSGKEVNRVRVCNCGDSPVRRGRKEEDRRQEEGEEIVQCDKLSASPKMERKIVNDVCLKKYDRCEINHEASICERTR
ncbi:axoneme-associated protein mst101(2)-like [Prorops nasuta]|uniref:axoneme-associated protein mst101(2)-like n=1 Tax=Prorops nasuta TaxID=863751 RepID=UPI0034CEEC4C